ncbi:MAG: CRISPR-associated endonuclease Cas2 [Chlorobiota bacterium]|jgi:CRISPR-associated protein Cas2|nr:CRISPR-associated endonuclease Cas2 [Chlorobiota bacterium]
MYVVVVYDVEQRRVAKVCQFLRRYLNWVQNSAFEGELSESQLEEVIVGVRKLVNRTSDSVYFYVIPDRKWCKRRVVGVEKSLSDTIL